MVQKLNGARINKTERKLQKEVICGQFSIDDLQLDVVG
jgi:hypothetical protein